MRVKEAVSKVNMRTFSSASGTDSHLASLLVHVFVARNQLEFPGGDSRVKRAGMLVGKFQLNP